MNKAPIISFTGTLSSGKTTVMNNCKNVIQGNWYYIDEVTRWVKRKYDIKINESGDNISQILMLNRHISNALLNKSKRNEGYDGFMLNRSMIDSCAFNEWLWRNDKIEKWVYEYGKQMLHELVRVEAYDLILYTSIEGIPLSDDGTRSTDPEFRKEIDEIIRQIIHDYILNRIPVITLSGDPDVRTHDTLEAINDVLSDDKQGIITKWSQTNSKMFVY